MKTIYIDVLITVNIFIDFMLILCTKRCLHINVSYKRMLMSSALGGFESLFALLPPLKFGLNIIFDLTGAAAIIFVAFGKCNIKTYLKRVAVYFLFSFSFCGIMIFIYTAFKPNGMEIYNDIVYFDISPVVLIILTLVCYYILKLIKRMTKGINGGGTCNVEIKSVMDNYSPDEKKIRLIPYESLGGSGLISGFKPQEVKIDGKKIDDQIYIGLCENILKGDIKALIPGQIVNG